MVEDRIDIIYTDSVRVDVGILSEYRLDLAYGADENTFTLTMPLKSRELTYKSHIYQYNTDVGGIVDGIKIDTEKKQLIYTGRTWQGILAGKVVTPPAGQDYRLLTGTSQEVIDELIGLCGLRDLFVAGTDGSEETYDIVNYTIRYGNLYTVLCDMLYETGCKLKIKAVYDANNQLMVELYATPYVDYSQDEEWSSSQRDFISERKETTVNHLICLGSGNLRDRHVIHLFSDGENIMPFTNHTQLYSHGEPVNIRLYGVYLNVSYLPPVETASITSFYGVLPGDVWMVGIGDDDEKFWYKNESFSFVMFRPYNDSHYILRDIQQQIFGVNEITEVFDYPNAQDTENYVELESEPDDYQENYSNYYTFEDGEYKSIEAVDMSYYNQLDTEPLDWPVNPSKYYVYQSGEYQTVDKVSVDRYVLTGVAPADWQEKYGNYYIVTGYASGLPVVWDNVKGVAQSGYNVVTESEAKNDWNNTYNKYYIRIWDGTKYIYERVNGVTKYTYTKQTKQPDNWVGSYSQYYQKKSKGTGYETVKAVKKKDKNGKVHDIAPTWKKGKYYTRTSETVAPKYDKNTTYYIAYSVTVAPTWVMNTYYKKVAVQQAPTFESGKYYEFVEYFSPPAFGNGIYIKYIDHYADLAANGAKRLQQYIDDANSITVNLKPAIEYDIGDVVGAIDEVTGLSVWRPITKKILKIERNRKIMRYETGGV